MYGLGFTHHCHRVGSSWDNLHETVARFYATVAVGFDVPVLRGVFWRFRPRGEKN
jgi:hypothetical protein